MGRGQDPDEREARVSSPGRSRRWLVRAARWLDLPHLVEDADALFAARTERWGVRAARKWYRWQVVYALVRVPGALIRRGGAGGPGTHWPVLAGQALRRVVRTPAVGVPFMLVVGVGMGATAFMVQTRRAVMKPDLGLGVPAWHVEARDSAGGMLPLTFTWTDAWVDDAGAAAGRLLPYEVRTMAVGTPAGRVSTTAYAVPERTFERLRVRPVLGRDVAAPGEVVLSHTFWRTYWASDPGVTGRSVEVAGGTLVVVGVAPPSFDGLRCCVRGDLWFVADVGPEPVRGSALALDVRDAAAASAAIRRLFAERMASVHRVELIPADGAAFGGERGIVGNALAVLLGLAVIAWLGTVSGALNLLLADVAERGREMRLRAALGSGRAGAVLQLLFEAGWLTVGAAAIAVVSAVMLLGMTPRVMPLITTDSVFDLDAGAPAWTAIAGAVVATCLVCGLAAGMVAARVAARRGADRGPGRGRASAWVLCVQVALATALVAVSIQFLRDVRRMDGRFVGFRTGSASVLTFLLADGAGAGMAPDELLRGFPAGAGLSRWLPVFGAPVDTLVDGAERHAVVVERVSAGWYDAIGLRLVAGRPARDGAEIVVSADIAGRSAPSPGALIGASWRMQDSVVRVVGVAEEATWGTGHPRATVYRGWAPETVRFGYVVAAPMAGRAVRMADAVRALRDSPYAVGAVGTMADLLRRSRILAVFLARMALVFGVLCFVVAMFGVHAQVTRWLRARDRELGIRQALGAGPRSAQLFVLRAFAVPLAGGVLGGGALALGSLRLLAALRSGTGWSTGVSVAGGCVVVAAATLVTVLGVAALRRGRSPVELMREA